MGPQDAEIPDLQSPELTIKNQQPTERQKTQTHVPVEDGTRAHCGPCKQKGLRKKKPEMTDNPTPLREQRPPFWPFPSHCASVQTLEPCDDLLAPFTRDTQQCQRCLSRVLQPLHLFIVVCAF